jgi:hypothetical protein
MQNLLTAQDAAKLASKYLTEMLPNTGAIRLEEVEVKAGPPRWLITLSCLDPDENPLGGLQYGPARRIYKTIEIDGNTGEFISMKIRQV